MSNGANELLLFIREVYNNRLAKGISQTQAVIFNKNEVCESFHISSGEIDNLLQELNDYGYIEKWIIPTFELKVDYL